MISVFKQNFILPSLIFVSSFCSYAQDHGAGNLTVTVVGGHQWQQASLESMRGWSGSAYEQALNPVNRDRREVIDIHNAEDFMKYRKLSALDHFNEHLKQYPLDYFSSLDQWDDSFESLLLVTGESANRVLQPLLVVFDPHIGISGGAPIGFRTTSDDKYFVVTTEKLICSGDFELSGRDLIFKHTQCFVLKTCKNEDEKHLSSFPRKGCGCYLFDANDVQKWR